MDVADDFTGKKEKCILSNCLKNLLKMMFQTRDTSLQVKPTVRRDR